jgi:hypothetical protein
VCLGKYNPREYTKHELPIDYSKLSVEKQLERVLDFVLEFFQNHGVDPNTLEDFRGRAQGDIGLVDFSVPNRLHVNNDPAIVNLRNKTLFRQLDLF